MTPQPGRLPILDALRGIAALLVCWAHFTYWAEDFLPPGYLKSSGTYGWLGVEVFFVISGFIIPYSLHRSGYQLGNWGTFVLKRLIRLEPPYLASIVVVLGLGYLATVTPGYQGLPYTPSAPQIFLHLAYLNVIFGYPWLNSVYWTLAIELQYYLLVGLLYVLIARRSLLVRAGTFGVLSTLAFVIPPEKFLFHWLFLFLLGMAVFQFYAGITKLGEFLIWTVLFTLGACAVNGMPIAGTGTLTALLVAFWKGDFAWPFLFFGRISYSLYLLHIPIGIRVINLSTRFTLGMPGKVVTLALALATSVFAAWLLYTYVERPAQEWSSSFRYRKKEDRAPAARPIGETGPLV